MQFLFAWYRFIYHAQHWPNSSIQYIFQSFKSFHNDPLEENAFLEHLAFGIFAWAHMGQKTTCHPQPPVLSVSLSLRGGIMQACLHWNFVVPFNKKPPYEILFMRIWEDLLANGGMVRESPQHGRKKIRFRNYYILICSDPLKQTILGIWLETFPGWKDVAWCHRQLWKHETGPEPGKWLQKTLGVQRPRPTSEQWKKNKAGCLRNVDECRGWNPTQLYSDLK